MVEAHVIDAWVRPADRTAPLYGYLILAGGFAAPLFLWLAGLGLVMSGESALRRTGSRRAATEAIVARGLEIFILAFLFRLQAFLVSPGSWLVTIFRVDILNVMGVALVCAGLLWGAGRSTFGALAGLALAATSVGLVTPIVRTAPSVGSLPIWMQWYVRPSGDQTTFTLFPWAGFVFAGAVAGLAIARRGSSARDDRWTHAMLAGGGLGIAAFSLWASYQPPIYTVTSFWTSSPTYYGIRVGVMTMLLAAAWTALPLQPLLPRSLSALAKLGRHSLFIYWIHVEMVYGYLSWGIHRRLPLGWALLAYAAFCTALYLLIDVKDRVLRSGRVRLGRWRTAPPVAA
jgi:uncharacterized membrane protein